MSSDAPSAATPAALERHIQTVLLAVVTSAILFAASYFYSDNRAKAIQQTQLEVLTQQVIEMRADLRSMQNSYVKREELRDLELRLRELEYGASKKRVGP